MPSLVHEPNIRMLQNSGAGADKGYNARRRDGSDMPKVKQQWVLFVYTGANEFLRISKPFKTKSQAEKARLQYPEKERGKIGIGMLRTME